MEEKEVLEEKNETKDTKALVKKILVIVGNVVFYAVIIVLFLFSLMNINAGNGTENFPNLFGKGMLSVESGSMERNADGYHPEAWDTYSIGEIKTGDLIYADVYRSETIDNLNIGDVITFVGSVNSQNALITHRIVYVNTEFNYVVCQGDYVITTAQNDYYYYDATNTDVVKNERLTYGNVDAQVVLAKDIRGVVTGVNSGAGSVLSNIRQNWLFYFVIPVAVVLLLEIVFVVKNFLDLRHEKNKASLADDKEAMLAELEAEKEKMRQELLAELRAQQAAQTPTAPEPEVVDEPIEQVEEAQEATDDTTEEVVEENNEEEAKEE